MISAKFPCVNELQCKPKFLNENYDACICVPYGRKCFLWFACINEEEQCVVMELNSHKEVVKRTTKKVRFHIDLASRNGTVFFGVMKNDKEIIIEDILHYKGESLKNARYLTKIEKMDNFFKRELKKDPRNEIDIKLAVMKHTYDEVIDSLLDIPYDIYSLKYINMSCNSVRTTVAKTTPELNKRHGNFVVRSVDSNELYELYTECGNQKVYYGIAIINDLYTSKMMKDVFSQTNIEKDMVCVYTTRLKGWIPVREMNKKRENRRNIGMI